METLTATQVPEISAIRYPIENSQQPERRAFQLCLEETPGEGEVGIIFDEQGEVSKAEMLRSTGYMAIDQEILITVETDYRQFPANRRAKAYTLPVTVEYDGNECVSLPTLRKSAGSPAGN